MSRLPLLTSAELRVMKALWAVGSGTVAEVRAELARRGQELAYTTVMTLLGRLAIKRAVVVDKVREPFVYRAAHRRESVLRDRLREFVREVFDGQADSLVLNLVEDETLSRAELRAIERRIADAERAGRPGAAPEVGDVGDVGDAAEPAEARDARAERDGKPDRPAARAKPRDARDGKK